MSTGEHDLETPVGQDADETAAEHGQDEAKPKLDLDVQITDAGPCKKHIKVTIPKADVERQFKDSLGSVRREAFVPGFRPGRAPTQLVGRRYRKEVAGQVKSALLMACMEQLDEDYKLNPIAQPDLDVEAIELPEDGPMKFELEVEVQPEFKLPAYKALRAKKPVKEVTPADVDAQFKTFLERYAQLVPKLEGGAEPGDYITADLTFHRDGLTFSQFKEVQFRLHPELRFQDGSVVDPVGALGGAKPGEAREADAKIGSGSPDPALRGQTIKITFHVLDLKQLRLPEVNAQFLESVGFDNEDDLREALRGILERRFEYQQRQEIRRQILGALVDETPFDLPADLVARQEQATLRRRVMELRQAGLSDSDLRAREAEIRANAHEATQQSLKEYFILSKVADAEGIKVEEEDIANEIEAIAARTDENPRRIRARIEKEGLADALLSQILERKTLDRILDYVAFEEVPLVEEKPVETLDQTAIAAPAESETEPKGDAGSEG